MRGFWPERHQWKEDGFSISKEENPYWTRIGLERRERGKPRDWDNQHPNHATNGSNNATAAAGCRWAHELVCFLSISKQESYAA